MFWFIVVYFCYILECFGYVFGIKWVIQFVYSFYLYIYIEEIFESLFFLEIQFLQVFGLDFVVMDN